MSVQFSTQSTPRYDGGTTNDAGKKKKTDLVDDPARRLRYVDEAEEKVTKAAEQFKTDPAEGVQSMKELVKKWEKLLRSEDWDHIDDEFKQGLFAQVKKARAFIKANDDVPSLEEVQQDPALAEQYFKSKKSELTNIEKNWRIDPDYYGGALVDHYNDMSGLLDPDTFAQLDPASQDDLIKHMGAISQLSQDMLAGTTTTPPDDDPEEA